MWIESKETKQGIRYTYYERYKCPVTGKIKRASITIGKNTPQAVKEASRLLYEKIERAKDKIQQDNKIKFYKVAMMWLEFTRPTVKIGTHKQHETYINKIFKYIDPDVLLIKITAIQIEELVHHIYYDENLGYVYVKGLLSNIKMIFRYAKRKGLIQDIHDIEDVRIQKKPFSPREVAKKQNKFLDSMELKSVLEQLQQSCNKRIALLYEFISLTGLRIGELLALRYCDYDKKNSTVNINGTISKYYHAGHQLQRGTPKTVYSVRDVALDKRATYIIEWIINDNKRMSLWGNNYNEQGYIFTTRNGNPYDMKYLNKELKKVHIEGKQVTAHIFRHTHISMLVELGVPLKSIMQRVGHNKADTTLSIYTHVTQAMYDDVISKLNQRQS